MSAADKSVMVIADSRQQRLALADTVRDLGLNLVSCMDSTQLFTSPNLPKADLWLVDSDFYNEEMRQLLSDVAPTCTLMGFLPAPYFNDIQAYAKWQRALSRKLFNTLNIADDAPKKRIYHSPWRYVVFLGASMGGPEAIKEFLDNLSPALPISIVIAHHFDDKMIGSLPRVLTRHNDWRCQLITTTQSLRSGSCLIAPIDKKVVCDSTGRVILTKEPWCGDYRPNIGEMLKNVSEVYGSQLIGIIFSGMGDDGSQHAGQLRANQSIFWAQDPASCASASQPQAFIDTGLCQFVATPKALAEKLTQLLRAYSYSQINSF